MINEQKGTNLDKTSDFLDAKIASLLIENPSITDQQISLQTGVSRQTINRRKNSSTVREMVRSVLAIPEREIRRLTAKALSRLEEMLDHEDPKIRLTATIALVRLSGRLMTNSFEEAFLKGTGTIS